MTLKQRLPGIVKGLFFALKLHILFRPVQHLMFWLSQISRLSQKINSQGPLLINDFYTFKFDYHKRLKLYEAVSAAEQLNGPVDYLEFGVAQGSSFKWWVAHNTHADSKFHGFDTFTGLPEDWGPFKKGEMSNDNAPPAINDSRVKFYQGLFQQTLPGFLASHPFTGNKKVIHMDADLYSATWYVLAYLHPYLKSGDIIFFDEYNCPTHEFLALDEFSRCFYFEYEVLGAVNNFYQMAIKVK